MLPRRGHIGSSVGPTGANSRIETGVITPTIADIKTITQVLGVDADMRAALLTVARQAIPGYHSGMQMSKQGWDNRLSSLTHLVRPSDHVRSFLPAVPAGLLQTFEYAHASVYTPVPEAGDVTNVAVRPL
jgi:hypothetical protein